MKHSRKAGAALSALSVALWMAHTLPAGAQVAAPAATAPKTAEAILQGAERVGAGRITAYRKDGHVLLSIPKDAFGQAMLWYAEVVAAPPEFVANNGMQVANQVVQLERKPGMVIIRDMSGKVTNRSGAERPSEPGTKSGMADTGISSSFQKVRPIDLAIEQTKVGPALAVLPILASAADGSVVVDATKTFSAEVASISPRSMLATLGVMPVAVDPERSYIESVRAFSSNLNIRSHLTFMATVPSAPAAGPVPLSVVVGHSFLFLPSKPMTARRFDSRVGYFWTDQLEFEASSGAAEAKNAVIQRFRLEKANPGAAVSDPVKPIIFYIGPGIPERWRNYVKDGVNRWEPVFRAAGFSDAIRAVDAPTPQQDPNWSAEDVGINVIRWLPQDRINAMGPHAVDPRTGEALSAHIQVWPSVIDGFGRYYFGMMHTIDPEAKTLPLPEKKLGEILAYAVAHEVGHTLGLRHNQIASTAYSIEQLRDPKFVNVHGPNSSIMAYGRFNQAAQPGDGVTQFMGIIGPYDYAAIKWGYGEFGKTPAEEQKALDAMAVEFTRDRRLYWAAAEGLDEMDRFVTDPRIQTENVGSDRIAATKLGMANWLRTLKKLNAAAGGNKVEFVETWKSMLGYQTHMLASVASLVGGNLQRFDSPNQAVVDPVPADEQRKAVTYLLGEGARTLDAYRAPEMTQRVAAVGGERLIDSAQAGLMAEVLTGSKLAILESQSLASANAYSPAALGRDVAAVVWGDMKSAPVASRVLQRAYLARHKVMIETWSKAPAIEKAAMATILKNEVPAITAGLLSESGDDTIYPAWLRGYLPTLVKQLQAAATATGVSEGDRLHFAEMASQAERLSTMLGAPPKPKAS